MVQVDHERVSAVAKHLPTLKEMPLLNFYSFDPNEQDLPGKRMYPSLNHPETINYFFFLGMQNYGYWTATEKGYEKPIFGAMYGKTDAKGSDLLWQIAKRTFDKDEKFFTPKHLANMSMRRFIENLFTDDVQVLPFRDLPRRYELTRAYGEWFIDNETTPDEVVAMANKGVNPLASLLQITSDIPGYNEDPMMKKNILLAMSLANRPEHYLDISLNDPAWSPIVDYHLMRLALRTGMVKLDAAERGVNAARTWTNAREESRIRKATYHAMEQILKESGKTMASVDNLFWKARSYCPEIDPPKCETCSLAPVCEKNIELFQPVIDTTFY